jgi:hypothetical protein
MVADPFLCLKFNRLKATVHRVTPINVRTSEHHYCLQDLEHCYIYYLFLTVRWEPPPKESQNGIITGYKIKWRRAGKGNTQTVSTDGSRRLYAITGTPMGKPIMYR